MNKTVINATLITTPNLSFVNESEDNQNFQFTVVKFFAQTDSGDIYPCICFEDQAYFLKDKKFHKGSHINMEGVFKNYKYEDINRTKHFTQILMVVSVMEDNSSEELEISMIEKNYSIMRKKGYQLIDMDELDYIERIS